MSSNPIGYPSNLTVRETTLASNLLGYRMRCADSGNAGRCEMIEAPASPRCAVRDSAKGGDFKTRGETADLLRRRDALAKTGAKAGNGLIRWGQGFDGLDFVAEDPPQAERKREGKQECQARGFE